MSAIRGRAAIGAGATKLPARLPPC